MPPNAGDFKVDLGVQESVRSPASSVGATSEWAISQASVGTKTKENANISERILHRHLDNYLI